MMRGSASWIVHRDLKPANVLVGDFGEIVVIDWGLAKDLDDDSPDSLPGTRTERDRPRSPTASEEPILTAAGAVMGTPAYMPPEQAPGEPVDERADVFSLGAMLYHLLAGAPPYAAKTATDVIAAAIEGKVEPLAKRAPDAPADLTAIIARAMAHEPAARYPTAQALAEELRRFQTGKLVAAHRYTVRERIGRFVRRHRAAVAIAAVAIAAFVVLGTLALRRPLKYNEYRQEILKDYTSQYFDTCPECRNDFDIPAHEKLEDLIIRFLSTDGALYERKKYFIPKKFINKQSNFGQVKYWFLSSKVENIYSDQIDFNSLMTYLNNVIKYLSFEDTITACKKCASYYDLYDLELCPICKSHYKGVEFNSCIP